MASSGARRVEVTVPEVDAALVREVAGLPRPGGAKARRVRKAMAPLLSRHQARTGAELVALLHGSLLAIASASTWIIGQSMGLFATAADAK
ncbi:MAG: hypothetical protein AAFX92_02135 [Pseudomonadota bacterium]